MKAMIRIVKDGDLEYECLAFICPGCMKENGKPGGYLRSSHSSGLHMLPVNTTKKLPSWNWDGNLEVPSLSPSIKTEWGNNSSGLHVCHSYLTQGVFNYLSDCTHSFVNQQIPLPDLPDWIVNE